MVFAPLLPPLEGLGPVFSPPPSARNERLSTDARDVPAALLARVEVTRGALFRWRAWKRSAAQPSTISRSAKVRSPKLKVVKVMVSPLSARLAGRTVPVGRDFVADQPCPT
jgi:hypothetical protein